MELREQLGDIDIYLLDQLLKGRLTPDMSILDAGCGGGRNLVYFLREGYPVFAVDENPRAVAQVRALATQLAPELPPESFKVSDLSEIPFPDERFDAVICSAVLHFARDEAQFGRMLGEMWRVLRPGGLFFARLASTIGIEPLVRPLQGRRYHLPDGSERFLVDEAMLVRLAEQLGGSWIEPLKTTVVQNQRSMSTWVLRKGGVPRTG
ncbi:MAG TPA: class I SAM-dependent methyltransferase [Thermoanaerobaculia bacterium]|jgi:SAM-dependent methyltransferase|nr:class I SAM-dependent methyltransferase [Thermoanaerobaculia bacterium]